MFRVLRWVVAAVGAVVGAPILVAVTILVTLLYYPVSGPLPQPVRSNFGTPPSVVYDDGGHIIGQLSASGGSNVPVKDFQIPDLVKQAVAASEDRGFFTEGPVSAKDLLRAAWADLTSGAPVQGGSTITQQYVKTVYTNGSKTLSRKFREVVLARMLSQKLTKKQILDRYLSIVYFGQEAYGVGAASQAYFRTPVSQLDASQAATLAGLLPAPSQYDPLFNLDAAEQRRETVLDLMHAQRYLTDAQYQQALAERLTLDQPGSTASGSVTLVYPLQQPSTKYPYFLDYVRQYMEQRVGYNELYHGGLRIQTTLDPKDQAAAESAIAAQLAGTQAPLQMATASVQPPTGYVTSLVGGRDYHVSQVDIALGGCPQPEPPPARLIVQATCQAQPNSVVLGGGTGRLAGSTFKPFTLAAALAAGISPQANYYGPATLDVPGCGGVCVIRNAEGGAASNYTLTTATWQSIDTVYVQVLKQVGIKTVAELAKRLGVTTAYDESDFGLSYTLGTNPVSSLEMASAYATFANHGTYVPPSPVVRAVDSQGAVVFDNSHPRGTRVLSPSVADTVTQILQGVIQHGTGNPNAVIGRPAAGKTGTANGPYDAWFVGYTPQLSAAVWMGYANNDSTPMLNVKGVQVFGGTYPAKAWHDLMTASLAGIPPANFDNPPPPGLPVNVLQGLQAGAARTPLSIGGEAPSSPSLPPPTAVAPPTIPTTTTTLPPDTAPPNPATPNFDSTTTTSPSGNTGTTGSGPPGTG